MYLIGKVIKAHGTKGEVVVTTETDRPLPETLLYYKNQTGDFQPVRITGQREVSKGGKFSFFVLFTGINDRNAAEALKGCEIYSAEQPLSAEQENDLPETDLVGFELVSHTGEFRGTVIDIHDNPAHPLVEIKHATGTVLIPWVDAYIADFDESSKAIHGTSDMEHLFEI